MHVGNLGQAGEHEALLIGAESRGQDRLQGLNLVFGGERDGFLLRRQPHTGANSQGAEVLFRRPTGDLHHIRQQCGVARVAQRPDGGSADLRVLCCDGGAQGCANAGIDQPAADGQEGDTGLSRASRQAIHHRLDIRLAAPGLNLAAGGVKGLGSVGASGLSLGLDHKLHHQAQLGIIYQQDQGLERGFTGRAGPSARQFHQLWHGGLVAATAEGAGELRLHFGFGIGQEPEQRFGGIAPPQIKQRQPGGRLFRSAGRRGSDPQYRDGRGIPQNPKGIDRSHAHLRRRAGHHGEHSWHCQYVATLGQTFDQGRLHRRIDLTHHRGEGLRRMGARHLAHQLKRGYLAGAVLSHDGSDHQAHRPATRGLDHPPEGGGAN